MKNNLEHNTGNARVGRTWSKTNATDKNHLPDNFILGMTNETTDSNFQP
ncbi:hypothetical protein ACFQZJ_12910 [Maribacter chungangensis]|uniref:Uncharacterized protein n=1 Tax=Maribacter chungangensis TaxID=1069117 RepID=A0ABW3B5K9_9FLAO